MTSQTAAPAVTIDVLPLKRVLALEENGNEILPVEPTPEEKPLVLLGRIDFGETIDKDSKKAKTGKEPAPAAPAAWQWQGLVENLQQAQQELNIILDFITHVEENDAITVSNMNKQKPLPHEAFNDLALRASSKIRQFLDVGKFLRRTAQALERQVEREAVFYGALMRLQRNWKVKRQRGVAAGPGESAGFSIDLSFALPDEVTFVSSARATALSSVRLEQDSTGLLQALPSTGRSLNKLNLSLRSTQTGRVSWERQNGTGEVKSSAMEDPGRQSSDVPGTDQKNPSSADRGVGEGVDAGAKAAQAVLRHIQGVIYDEHVFEWVGREAVLPNSGMIVIGIGDMCLQVSLGHAASLTLELSEIEKDSSGTDAGHHESEFDKGEGEPSSVWSNAQDDGIKASFGLNKQLSIPRLDGRITVSNDSSLVVCLHQAFHQGIFGFPVELDPGLVTFKMGVGKSVDGAGSKPKEAPVAAGTGGKEAVSSDGSNAVRHFASIMRHRVLSSRVLAELEKQVSQVPHFQLAFHPTWHPRVSAWDLSLATPTFTGRKGLEWGTAESQEVRFQCTVVLRDESLTVEGLEGDSRLDTSSQASSHEFLPLSKHNVGLSELPTFLLFQVARELVSWLHDEAITMGLTVSRDVLSVVFQLGGCDDVAVVACPDVKAHCINWWLRTWTPGMDDSSRKEFGSDSGHHQRFLGPLDLETLKKLVMDIVNLEGNLEAGFYD
ncbi:unnamed protein product [Calypogeia fissa]